MEEVVQSAAYKYAAEHCEDSFEFGRFVWVSEHFPAGFEHEASDAAGDHKEEDLRCFHCLDDGEGTV